MKKFTTSFHSLSFRFHSESYSMFDDTKIMNKHGFQIEYSTHISTNDGCKKGMAAGYNILLVCTQFIQPTCDKINFVIKFLCDGQASTQEMERNKATAK